MCAVLLLVFPGSSPPHPRFGILVLIGRSPRTVSRIPYRVAWGSFAKYLGFLPAVRHQLLRSTLWLCWVRFPVLRMTFPRAPCRFPRLRLPSFARMPHRLDRDHSLAWFLIYVRETWTVEHGVFLCWTDMPRTAPVIGPLLPLPPPQMSQGGLRSYHANEPVPSYPCQSLST